MIQLKYADESNEYNFLTTSSQLSQLANKEPELFIKYSLTNNCELLFFYCTSETPKNS